MAIGRLKAIPPLGKAKRILMNWHPVKNSMQYLPLNGLQIALRRFNNPQPAGFLGPQDVIIVVHGRIAMVFASRRWIGEIFKSFDRQEQPFCKRIGSRELSHIQRRECLDRRHYRRRQIRFGPYLMLRAVAEYLLETIGPLQCTGDDSDARGIHVWQRPDQSRADIIYNMLERPWKPAS